MSRSVQGWDVALAVALIVFGGSVANADTIVNIKGYGADGACANIIGYPVEPGTLVDLFNPVEIVLPAGDWLLNDAWVNRDRFTITSVHFCAWSSEAQASVKGR